MRHYSRWMIAFLVIIALSYGAMIYAALQEEWVLFTLINIIIISFALLFLTFWNRLRHHGIQAEAEIGRVLGRDAKEAMLVGEVGVITYNDEYEATWISDYLKQFVPDLVNHKLTTFLPQIKDLFESDVDTITGTYEGNTFEVSHKEGSQILFVRNITELSRCRAMVEQKSVVVGVFILDNYSEYQAFDNDEILNEINRLIRGPLSQWARENKILMRRMRSDRYLLVLDSEILESMRRKNFPILQIIKDSAVRGGLSITLSAVFAADQSDFLELDKSLNDLSELVQSRGGDQIAIKIGDAPVEFVGGGSEKASQRSKVRVRIVGSSIQDVVKDSRKVFILGHVNTDYDAMGAALAASNWAKALGKEAYIVLKDVSRDAQLQATMNVYSRAITQRHTFITEEKALEMMDPSKDVLILVDHSNPAISSGREMLKSDVRKIVIDHHRRTESTVDNMIVSYIESQSSSTCELMTELIDASPEVVPIYEVEATIMYLGLIVDTNRFKQHTSERTFQAAARLRAWGANAQRAEQALQVDYQDYRRRAQMIEQAKIFKDHYLIDALNVPMSRTEMSVISDELLNFKGCQAAFTIAINENNGNIAVSARSDGSINVQKIMEKMNGGGHFSAAALERENTTVEEVAAELSSLLEKEENE